MIMYRICFNVGKSELKQKHDRKFCSSFIVLFFPFTIVCSFFFFLFQNFMRIIERILTSHQSQQFKSLIDPHPGKAVVKLEMELTKHGGHWLWLYNDTFTVLDESRLELSLVKEKKGRIGLWWQMGVLMIQNA